MDNQYLNLLEGNNAELFRTRYNQAVKEGMDQFTFQHRGVHTRYAYYILQYLVLRGVLKEEHGRDQEEQVRTEADSSEENANDQGVQGTGMDTPTPS